MAVGVGARVSARIAFGGAAEVPPAWSARRSEQQVLGFGCARPFGAGGHRDPSGLVSRRPCGQLVASGPRMRIAFGGAAEVPPAWSAHRSEQQVLGFGLSLIHISEPTRPY